ncbi:MAG: AbrB/MazE/SpoVT family DNA-binding domain-containing protein [Candidatus Pacearchaeota archaeon]|nr:AbrB/MazE/SpoVT family DNA-binding domain-containing protein [Candidatus Pacearchaeota archaeon]
MIIKRQIGEKGQVVIPKDIRDFLKLKKGEKIIFEIIGNEITIKKEQDTKKFLEDFLDVPKPKKNLSLNDIRKIEEESYDIS